MSKPKVTVNERVARWVTHEQQQHGVTWDSIQDAGGPSPATMTKIASGRDVDVALTTTFKLDDALGWVRGTVRDLAAGVVEQPTYRVEWVAGMMRERRRSASQDSGVGGTGDHYPHGRVTRRGKANEVQLEAMREYVVQQQAILAQQQEALMELLARLDEPDGD